MPIIGNLPVNLQNGTSADASQVMSDLNYIVNQVNANANPLGTLTAPTGTTIPMAQASAPPGWTSSTVSDTALRYNSTTGGGTGGTTNWSSWNGGGQFNVNSFTLSVAQLPVHNHTITDSGHAHGAPGGGSNGYAISVGAGGTQWATTGSGGQPYNLQSTTGSNFTGISGTNNTGNGSSIQPNFTTPAVKYVDHIMAVKS